ncbi:lethal giant larvae like, C-terminal-domain-containing protein [Vararia minispora EC-137]|uniref:Lethal giant larvae like, C-terminal-domain-containing protein n=1 Tax=Vararia minispora EC-137 TaxID=1314806 RepID=A0ACB8QRD4_9AGAM|nr:lethal giant larvae like, C-terminal-domain-containing protein [Vararia minispora EC-137]
MLGFGHGYTDFSVDLRDAQDWTIGNLMRLNFCLDVAALAIDPVSQLLAVGTLGGIVYILGAPGVQTKIHLPTATPIKFLEFATNIYKLVCIDDNDKLYLWDLTSLNEIKLEAMTRVSRPATYLTLSPSHTHAFISTESGDVKTYDLLCRRFSEYTIPSAWDMYASSLQSDGIPVDMEGGSSIPTQIVVHPRNVGLVFVAYGGGVVLVDLKDRRSLRVYELLIPAGAPGGAGYTDPDLLKHRRPPVTTTAIHPSGHFFAVGYADGSLAFWAVDDDEQPLLVRTLDDVDIHVVDGDKLDDYLPGSDKSPPPHKPREPIFKLAWSGFANSKDQRGGETSLLILGGQCSHDAPGVNVLWLPAFNPPEPPVTSTPHQGLHPHFRKAMQKSLDPLDAYFYSTSGLVQDFLLIPRDNPFFSGAWEPTAVIFISEGIARTRAIEAFEYPPPSFAPSSFNETLQKGKAQSDSSSCLESDIADTLRDLQTSSEPKNLTVPFLLWSGPSSVITAQIHSIDRSAYEPLSELRSQDPSELKLEGGIVLCGQEAVADIKAAKFETRRIIISQHTDQSIRFVDISAQLLLPDTETLLVSPFPKTLPSLTIEPLSVWNHPSVCSRITVDHLQPPVVRSFYFSSEALELSILFSTGAVIIYRLSDRENVEDEREMDDFEMISLEHIPVTSGLRFKPVLLISARIFSSLLSAVTYWTLGFAAVGYADGSMTVLDMRGPRVIFRSATDKDSHKHGIGHLLQKSHHADAVGCFVWTICSLSTGKRSPSVADLTPRVRLLAIRGSGDTSMYTLVRPQSREWTVSPDPARSETIPPLPLSSGGAFVLDGRLGAQLKADKNRFAVALDKEHADSQPRRKDSNGAQLKSVLVVVGAKSARCYADLNGDKRIGKADWGGKSGLAVYAQLVERNASCVLVIVTDKSQALVYSLPTLENLHTFPLPTPSSNDFLRYSPPSIDTTGDVLTLVGNPATAAVLDTFFSIRRGYHTPQILLTERRDGATALVPPLPTPVSMGPAGWFAGAGSLFGALTGAGISTMTGQQVDALLAGPNRPIPEKPAPRTEREKYKEWTSDPAKATASAAAQTRSSLYNRLHAALAERGEALGDLEQSFNQLGEGSRSMVDQASRLAAQQTTKTWFGLGRL